MWDVRECYIVDSEHGQRSAKTSFWRYYDIQHWIYAREPVFASASNVLRQSSDSSGDWIRANVAKISVIITGFVNVYFVLYTALFAKWQTKKQQNIKRTK